MAKRIMAKTGEYQNSQGETKGNWTEIGVILSNENGEYALIDPTVNLAGVLMKQRVMNHGKQVKSKGDMVMCSIFTDEQKQGQIPPQQPGGHIVNNGDDFNDQILW